MLATPFTMDHFQSLKVPLLPETLSLVLLVSELDFAKFQWNNSVGQRKKKKKKRKKGDLIFS